MSTILDPQPPSYPPVVSLCVICGDDEALVVHRMLTSVLERDSGPMFDEVSVYWHGSPGKKPKSLQHSTWITKHGFTIPFIVNDGPWRNDRAWARQISFEQANGEWRAYLDAHDIIPTVESKIINEGLKTIGIDRVEGEKTAIALRDWLKSLPKTLNYVETPYFYAETANGQIGMVRRRRMVRWAAGWCWGDPIYEEMFPVRSCIQSGIFGAGLVIQHRASKDVTLDFTTQNILALEQKVGNADLLDHKALYAISTVHIKHRNDAVAMEYLLKAVRTTPPPNDTFVYQILLAQIRCRAGMANEAALHAMAAIVAQPDHPAGYLELGRAHFHLKDYKNAVRWFRLGHTKEDPMAGRLPYPAATYGQILALGAHAFLNTDQESEALTWAEKAVTFNPGFFSERTRALCLDLVARRTAEESFDFLVEYLRQRNEIQQLHSLVKACPADLERSQKTQTLLRQIETEQHIKDKSNIVTLLSDEIPSALREAFNLSQDVLVVGNALVRTAAPSTILADIEATASPGDTIHIIVPDAGHAVPTKMSGALSAFTANRLLEMLQPRGRIQTLYTGRATSLEEVEGGYHLLASYIPGPRPTPKSITIWCPYFAQLRGPRYPGLKGTGNAEEAASYLSEALANRGYDVTVFAPLPLKDEPVVIEKSVIWRPLHNFSPDLPFDHLLLHRAPAITQVCPFKAKNLWTWHHDYFYSEWYWNTRTANSTRHLYTSRWQRKLLEGYIGRPTAGRTVFNGIPSAQLDAAELRLQKRLPFGKHRDYHTVAYAAAPTRGLDRMLTVWPEILAAIPNATLFVYYRIDTVKQFWRSAYYNNVKVVEQMQAVLEALIAKNAVVFRGQVNQDDLCEEFLQMGVLAHPSAHPETYMTQSIRAAAAGMRVVSTDTGCLPEILPDGRYLVPGAISHEEWAAGGKDAFVQMLLWAMVEPEEAYDREGIGKRTREIYSWDHVARRVEEAFEAAEGGDEAFFASDVTEGIREMPEGITDIRVPTEQIVEALRREAVEIQSM